MDGRAQEGGGEAVSSRLRISFVCDAPGCEGEFITPHARSIDAERQILASGWTIVRWRKAIPGLKRDRWKPTKQERVPDLGGGNRKLHLCRTHGAWRPAGGVVLGVQTPGAG